MSYPAIVASALLLVTTVQWIVVAFTTRAERVTRGEAVRRALSAAAGLLIVRVLIPWEAVVSIWVWALPALAAVWAAAEIGSRWHRLPAGTQPSLRGTVGTAGSAGVFLLLLVLTLWQTWFR